MNVRIRYEINFTAGIYYAGETRMNNYRLSIWLLTNSEDPLSQNIAFERIKYFMHTQMHSTIFVNLQDKEQYHKFVQAGLNVTTLPGDPVDQLIGIMLYYKLNALMEDRMLVLETEISSDLGEGVIYLHGENEISKNIQQSQWWHDPDLVHCDLDLESGDKLVAIGHAGAWRDLDLAWPDLTNSDPEDNTVVFAKFGPDETR